MKTIIIPSNELYNEKENLFIEIPETKIAIEHSLVSISKWESKWHKAYLSENEKTDEEIISYIKYMVITQNVKDYIFDCLPPVVINEINSYINDPMTATVIRDVNGRRVINETITSELIYYWMFKLGIPKECEKWHINRLLTLIKIYGVKDQPPKKMNRNEILRQNKALNAQRRARMKSRG